MKLYLDTLHKKPKVYNLAILTAAVLTLMVLLFVFGGGSTAIRFSCLFLALYFLAAAALLLRAFFLQMRYNLYSYNTIIYFGFALFSVFTASSFVLLFVRIRGVPEQEILPNIVGLLLRSAKTYVLMTAPFLLVFSVGLAVSNLSLIRHEGFRVVNLLGIILAFLLVSGEVLIFLWDYMVSGSRTEVMLHDMLTNLLAAVYLYFECMLLGTMVADVIASRVEPEKDKDFIIILGCGIRKDGTPSPLLRGRVDRALTFAAQQEALTGKKPIFVTSGGQGPDEPISESASMKRYLLEKGIPAERILEEDRSTDTFENMKFSKEKIWAVNPQGKIAFSTTNYHVFRGGLKARRVKMRALGMGARTKWYFWPNAAVREFVGLLTEHRLKQGLIFGSMVVFYVVLTLLAYQY